VPTIKTYAGDYRSAVPLPHLFPLLRVGTEPQIIVSFWFACYATQHRTATAIVGFQLISRKPPATRRNFKQVGDGSFVYLMSKEGASHDGMLGVRQLVLQTFKVEARASGQFLRTYCH
jgi:hypothetical protein